MIESRDDWCVQAVNLVQGLIGCAYGFVPVETIETAAGNLGPAEPPYRDVFIRGVVFTCITRKMGTLSTAERALLIDVVEEIGRTSRADVPRIVDELRTLLGIRGPAIAEQIRDIIDSRYASKLTPQMLASEVLVKVKEAKSEFERRFGLAIADYVTRRRVEEGLQMVRAGVSVEAAALNVGNKSKRHFYKAARKVTGTTPARCRD